MEEPRLAATREKREYNALLAVREYVDDIVKTCFATYDSIKKLCDQDEAANEGVKYEYREYKYHKSYSAGCDISITSKEYKTERFDTFEAYQAASNGGLLKNLSKLKIDLNLSYQTGKEGSLSDHNHEFELVFEPELTTISYSANYEEPHMKSVYEQLQQKLDAFPATYTIFTGGD